MLCFQYIKKSTMALTLSWYCCHSLQTTLSKHTLMHGTDVGIYQPGFYRAATSLTDARQIRVDGIDKGN